MAKIKTYVHVRDLSESEKCAPQAQVVLAVVKAAGEAGIQRKELIEALTQKSVDGGLKTNQAVDRIFAFYRKGLVAAGLIAEIVTEIAKPVKEPKAPKPEGEAKPKRSRKKAAAEPATPVEQVPAEQEPVAE